MSGKKGKAGMPMWAVDGLVDVADAAGSLAQAVECAAIAVRTDLDDPMEFMPGTLDVLLVASEDVRVRAAKLRDKAEGR